MRARRATKGTEYCLQRAWLVKVCLSACVRGDARLEKVWRVIMESIGKVAISYIHVLCWK